MKIDEVKAMIREHGLTDELMAEFLLSLRRVRGNWNKTQHCYLLAYEIRESDYTGAVRLIQYGFQNFAEDDTSRRFCYEHLGRAHQANGRTDLAKECYQAAKELMKRTYGGVEGDTLLALRNELELTGYHWSADLEALYHETDPESDIVWTLRPNSMLLAMAEYIVAEHRQDEAFMAHARDWMDRLLFDVEKTETDRLWARHHVDTSIMLTEAQEAFLRRIAILK